MTLTKADVLKIEGIVDNALAGIKIPAPDSYIRMDERVGVLSETVKQHDKFIEGNGTDGAKTTIPLVSQKLETLTGDFHEFKAILEVKLGRYEKQFITIILLLVGTLIATVMDLAIRL